MKFLNHNIDSIIFDLDGTLWDSTEACLKAWYRTMDSEPLIKEKITREMIQGVFGMQHDLIAIKLFPNISKEDQERIMSACFLEENNTIRETGGKLYDDAEAVLKELSKSRRLFIVSNCQAGYIEAFFHYHRLEEYFTDHECSGNTGLAKSENIKSIIQRNGLKSPVYVGDTEGDGEAARLNGIPFIYASYGFGQVKDYWEKIESLKDILSKFDD